MLSLGPGSGPLLGSAGAWSSLAGQYALAADDLIRTLAESSAVWEGAGAEAFRAAHAPMLAWLADQAAGAAAAAARHTGVAAAYDAALAAMPTLAEIAANRATLAAILGTNFLGINTIPIAVTEADYIRMWIQAASVMEGYQAAAEALTANTPQAPSAPHTLKGGTARSLNIQDLIQPSGTHGHLDVLDLLRSLGLDIDDLAKLVEQAAQFGLSALSLAPLVAIGGYELAAQGFWLVWAMIIATPIFVPLMVNALQQSPGFRLDADTAPPDTHEAPLDADQPGHRDVARAERPQLTPAAALALPASSAPAASAPVAQASPAPSALAPSAPPAPTGYSFYAVGGGGGGGEKFGPPATTGSSSSASSSAASSAAAAQSLKDSASGKRGAAARARSRAKGRKVKLEEDQRIYADGYMDLEEEPALAPVASEVGGGLLGASGANQLQNPRASGFQKLSDGSFKTGPTTPMLPTNWNLEGE